MELWFTEKNTETCDFSIKVKEHLYSEQTPFQRIDFLTPTNLADFLP